MGIEIIKKTATYNIFRCDVCDQIVESPIQCVICEKILCSEHVINDDRDQGDYPDKYCKRCWTIRASYREQIENAQLECDERIVKLNAAWFKKAKE